VGLVDRVLRQPGKLTMVRFTAIICTIVFAALLAWTAVISITRPDPLVVPTGGVIHRGTQDTVPRGLQAQTALAARTEQQRWRSDQPPPPEGEPLASTPPEQGGPALTQQWLGERQEDWPVIVDHGFTKGLASLPADRDSVLVQPQGRNFRQRHNSALADSGGWIIFGVSLLLSLFLLLRGRIRIAGGFSGTTIQRFDALERANHWVTASSFVLLALTGLILLYGRWLLAPLLGAGAYSGLARASLYLHIAFIAPFLLGLVIMGVLWLRQNLPERLDLIWLAHFGGFLNRSGDNPPARRFNAGQKLVFWAVLLGGLLMAASGFTLMFPFFWTDVVGMEWVLLGHALLALLLVGLILGHIYIGTIGMEGAIDAMWSGQVDRRWAKEHHSLWVEEEMQQAMPGRQDTRHAPAE
jgi:formate dehydrogenase subunit gamma